MCQANPCHKYYLLKQSTSSHILDFWYSKIFTQSNNNKTRHTMQETVFKIVQEQVPWLRRLLRRPATDCRDACLNSSLS